MPAIKLTAPDGKIIRLTPPEDASPEDIQKGIDSVVSQYKTAPAEQSKAEATPDRTKLAGPPSPKDMAREAESVEPGVTKGMEPTIDPTYVVADVMSGGLVGGAKEAVKAGVASVAFQEAGEKSAELAGQVGLGPTGQAIAGIGLPIAALAAGKKLRAKIPEAVPGLSAGAEIETGGGLARLEEQLKDHPILGSGTTAQHRWNPETKEFDPIEAKPKTSLSRPWHEMSFDELDTAMKTARASEESDLESVFGEQGAKRYRTLQRRADGSSPQKADEAIAEMHAMEAKLTPEQEAKLDAGDGTDGWETIKAFRDAKRDVRGEAHSPRALGESLVHAITDVGDETDPSKMDFKQLLAYAKIKEAHQLAHELGYSTEEVSAHAISAAKRMYGEDSDFMLRRYAREPEADPMEPKPGIRAEELRRVKGPLVPAMQITEGPTKGKVIIGKPGETHADLLHEGDPEFQATMEGKNNVDLFYDTKSKQLVDRHGRPVPKELTGEQAEQIVKKDQKEITLQSAAVPGAKEFLEQDVIPKAAAVRDYAKMSVGEIKAVVSPKSVSQEAKLSGEALTKYTSQARESMRQRGLVLKQMEADASKWSEGEQTEFWHRADERKPQTDPEKEKVAQALYSMLDQKREEIHGLGTGALKNYIENYFPRLYKNVDQAAQFFGGKSLEGTKGFLKGRRHETLEASLNAANEAGLEPAFKNPVEMARRALDNQDRYIAGQKFFKDLKEQNLVKFLKPGEKPPPGFADIDDKISRVNRPIGREDLDQPAVFVPAGRYVAPEPVARIINNYTGPGLSRSGLYRGFREASGFLNMIQLGASAFHLSTTALTAAGSDLARAIRLVSDGKPLKSVVPLLKGLTGTSLAADLKQGGKLFKYAYDDNFKLLHPELAKFYQAYIDSGAGFSGSEQFRSSLWESFRKHSRDGNVIGAALRFPFAAIEQASRPLFDYLIPRVKAGAFMDLARDWMETHPGATEKEALSGWNKITDSIDNRFGMVNYDRWNLDRRVRDSLFVMFRAPGWTLGNIREFGGGTSDIVRARMTDKAAFALALPMAAGWYGALYQYAKTETWPDLVTPLSKGDPYGALANMLAPMSGRQNADGSPERVVLPGLHKDLISFMFNVAKPGTEGDLVGMGKGAVRFGQAKLNPWLNILSDVYGNEDFYHRQIADRSKGVLSQAGDEARFVARETTPFSMSSLQRRMEEESGKPVGGPSDLLNQVRQNPGVALESQLGVMPAPQAMTGTPLERYLKGRHGQGAPITQEQFEKRGVERKLQKDIRGKDQGAIKEDLSTGKLSNRDVKQAERESSETPQERLFKGAHLDDLVKAIPMARDEEKAPLWRALVQKFDNAYKAKTVTPDQVRGYVKEIQKLKGEVQGLKKDGLQVSWSEIGWRYARAKKSGDDGEWKKVRTLVNKRVNAMRGQPNLGMDPEQYKKFLPIIVEALKPEPEALSEGVTGG